MEYTMTDTMPVVDATKPADGTDEAPAVEFKAPPADKAALDPEVETNTVEYWRTRSRQNERTMKAKSEEARTNAEAVAALQAKIDGKEAEHTAAQAAQKVRDEALASANGRIVKSEVKAAAKGVLADPKDAYKFLDLDDFKVDDDGNVDEDAIAAALADLVKDKPYLAAQGGKRFQGSADGGTRNGSAPASQLSRSDLEGMSPEAIVQAKAEGRLDDALGIKS